MFLGFRGYVVEVNLFGNVRNFRIILFGDSCLIWIVKKGFIIWWFVFIYISIFEIKSFLNYSIS